MNNLMSIFSEIYTKFMDNINNDFFKKKKISESDGYYLNIIYSLKKMTLSKFAELAKVTKPAATQIINKFLKMGFVTKEVSKNDKRVCYIELTKELKVYFNDYYKNLNNNLSFLSKEEKKELDNLLLKINNNL